MICNKSKSVYYRGNCIRDRDYIASYENDDVVLYFSICRSCLRDQRVSTSLEESHVLIGFEVIK